MFFQSFAVPTIALLAALSQVQAHSFISPGLGVAGAGARSDVQKPSTATPCGKASLAAIDTSTAVAATNGLFAATITNFNAGTDGSTEITSATVDTTGTGKSFTGVATVVKNGIQSPTTTGAVALSIQLPAGTTCTGGATGNKCLVSLTTAGKFGNCVVVSTGAAGAAPAAAVGTNTTTTDPAVTGTTGTNTTTTDPAVTAGNTTTTTTTTGTGNTTTTTTTGTGKGAGKKGNKGLKGAAAAGGAGAGGAKGAKAGGAGTGATNAAAGGPKKNAGGAGKPAAAGRRAHPRDWFSSLWNEATA